ncbi:uncharacterized protein LOC134043481 isoform X3 [Cinclus cinclus]|uniref:uncharacterized protein LOC134043481 isoform X3 n=1 Tax=Cinclus cinclus TaxID=127875 RepID=UPI002E1587CF
MARDHPDHHSLQRAGQAASRRNRSRIHNGVLWGIPYWEEAAVSQPGSHWSSSLQTVGAAREKPHPRAQSSFHPEQFLAVAERNGLCQGFNSDRQAQLLDQAKD